MKELFEAYYNELLTYAQGIVTTQMIPVSPEELLNDAFVSFYESGKDFDLLAFKKLIAKSGFKETNYKVRQYSFDENFIAKEKHINGDFQCSECKEILPAAAFHLRKFNNYKFIPNLCGKCEGKRTAQWQKENKIKWNAYMRSRRPKKEKREAKPIHDLWNKANKKYIERQREELSDVYIRSLLKGKEVTPETIFNKREELLIKRNNEQYIQTSEEDN